MLELRLLQEQLLFKGKEGAAAELLARVVFVPRHKRLSARSLLSVGSLLACALVYRFALINDKPILLERYVGDFPFHLALAFRLIGTHNEARRFDGIVGDAPDLILHFVGI